MARTTKAVPAGDDRYRTLVECAPDPMYVTRDGIVLFVNPAAVRLFGAAAPQELIGTRILDRVHPAVHELATGRLKSLADGAASTPRAEVTFLRLDGTAVDVEVESTTIIFDGAPAIHETVRDVTVRKRKEDALERMGSLAKIGAWEIRLEDLHASWSTAVYAILGLSDAVELTLEQFIACHADESSGIMRRAFTLAVEEGKSFTRDSEIVAAAGKRKWIRTQGEVIQDGSITSRRVFGTIQDISEIRLIDRVTQESELTLNQVEQITHIGHWSVNTIDGALFHSDEIKRIFGYEPSEYSLSVEDAINAYHPEDREEVIRSFTRATETGEGYDFDLRVIQPDGNTRNVHSTGYTEQNADGKVTRVYGVLQDITERKQSEAALRETAMRLELALRYAKAGTWDWDVVDGGIRWSPEMFDLFGVASSPGAASFETWRAALHPEDVATAEARIGQALTERTVLNSDYRVVLPDGAIRWINAVGQGLYDTQGRPIRMLGLCLDITERQEAERTLRLMRASVDAASEALFWMTPDSRIVHVNDAACRSLGYTRDELLALRVPDVDVRYDADVWRTHFPALRAAGSLTFESEQRTRDGRVIPVEIVANYVRFGEEEFNCAFVRDITERRHAEAALGESVRRYRDLFDQANEGLVIMTTEGHLSEINRAFAEMHGYTVEELRGIDIQDLDALHERALEDRAGLIRRILDGEVVRFEVDHHHKDGHVFPLSVTASLINLGGQPSFLAFHQDITARTQAEAAKATLEAQLLQAQKLESVGLLAGGVAHDFNNMIGVILGTVELAMEQVDTARPLHADLLEIRKAAVRSADLTRQLLAFARQQAIAPTVLDLNETVPGMLAMLHRLIGEDIRLLWQPAGALWPVMMDRSQMDQILTNLCVNARHAIAGIGTVIIGVANVVADAAFCAIHAEAVPGEYVRLSVRDTGSGMDAATQARIFEPFFSTRGVGQGTGLGLATVYGAVKQNQGFATVASTLGEGTTFEIYLPRHRGAPTPARLSGAVAAELRGGETILLVEDEPALIRLFTKALEAQGYVVLAAGGAADALHLATTHAGDIHLLVSDVVMPEMNGRDLAQALLGLRPTLKPLFMSGHTADVIAIRGLLAPGVAFIEKPFTPVALAAKVRAVLDGEQGVARTRG